MMKDRSKGKLNSGRGAAEHPVDQGAVQFDELENEATVVGDAAGSGTEVERLRAELVEAEKRTLMAVADLDNYRKRANKNAQDQVKYATLPLMNEMLQAVDNLNRAVDAAQQDAGNEALREGVKMVADQLMSILLSNHCQAINAVGEPFDPNLHEAVQMQRSDDYPANTVMMEIRTGYKLHDRVIRPAQVFVSTGP